MNILIVFINNPNAIVKGFKYDIRYDVLSKIAIKLSKYHKIFVTPCNKGSKLTKDIIQQFTLYKNQKIDLCICWNPVKNKFKFNRYLSYENGFLKNSIIIDPKGLLNKSKYVDSLNSIIENNYNEVECKKYINNVLQNNLSKRPQKIINDIPNNIKGKYIFLPTQKANDISIKDYSKVNMFQCIEQTSQYCKKNNIPLVVKIHPHLGGNALTVQQDFCKKLGNIHLSTNSITDLINNARFTVCVNGGTLVDNFICGSPVLSCGRSMFCKTEALIFNEDIHKGLDIMINKKYNLNKMLDKQKKVIWWIYNNSLFCDKSVNFNIKVLENHLKEKLIF